MKTKKQKRWQKPVPKLTAFKIPLAGGFVIIVEYWSHRRQITRFATVLIRLRDEGEGSDEICRYDTAHGFAHLDVLDNKRRVIHKIPVPGAPSFRGAIEYALSDLKTNHQKYWETFRANQKSSRQ